MADYVEVPDFTTGDNVTADNLDVYLRGNFKSVYDALVAGRPIRFDTTAKHLEVLPVTYAKYVLSGNLTLTKNAYTTVNQWTAEHDANGWLSANTNITPGAGKYRVSAQIYFSGIENGKTFYPNLQKHSGGADALVSYYLQRNSSGGTVEAYGILPPVIIELAAGDYLWLKIYNGNAVSDSVMYAYADRNFLNIEKLY